MIPDSYTDLDPRCSRDLKAALKTLVGEEFALDDLGYPTDETTLESAYMRTYVRMSGSLIISRSLQVLLPLPRTSLGALRVPRARPH